MKRYLAPINFGLMGGNCVGWLTIDGYAPPWWLVLIILVLGLATICMTYRDQQMERQVREVERALLEQGKTLSGEGT